MTDIEIAKNVELEKIDEIMGIVRLATGYEIGYEHIFCVPQDWIYETTADLAAVYGAKSHFVNHKYIKSNWINLPVSYVSEEQCDDIVALYDGYQKNEKIIFPYIYDDGHLVRFGEGENEREKEYTLILDKEGTEDIQGLLSVTVNGQEIKPIGNIYNANIGEITQTATVTAITINDKDLVKIGETNSKEHISTEVVDCTEVITTYKITVTDPNHPEQTKEYVLNIKKPSADNTLL